MKEENPKNIALVLDGNRRYGRKIGNGFKGHKVGAQKVEKLFDWCKELGIKEVTLYCFSMENFKRPKEEVDYLMKLFRMQIRRLKRDKRLEDTKIEFIGRLNLFPKVLRDDMGELMEKTAGNDGFKVNFAMGYGGRAEIVDAAKKLVYKVVDNSIDPEDIDEEMFSENLYMKDEPDIIIRTGGDKRVSNFLIYQGAYSELFFLEKLWPEFEKEDLIKVIEEYKKRERRFGE